MKTVSKLSLLLFLSLSSPLIGQEENPFRPRIEAPEFLERLRSLAPSLEGVQKKADDPAWPSVGVRVGSGYRKGNAYLGGIEPRSIIKQRGDYLSWAGFAPEIPVSKPHLVKYVDPEGIEKKVLFDDGPIGASTQRYYSLEMAYLRGEVGTRDPEWDEELIIACRFCQADQRLAESSMHYAIAKGYPIDDLAAFLLVQFQTYSPAGPDKAIDRFLSHFDTGEEMPWVYLPPLHEAIAVTGRIDLMKRVAERAGENCVFDQSTIAKFLKWTNGETRFPRESLLQRAIAKRGDSIADRFTATEIDVRSGPRPAPPLDGHIEVSRRPGKRFNVEYTSENIPHNIHYYLKANLKATGGLQEGYQTRFLLLLANLYEDPHDIPRREKYSMAADDLDRRVLFCKLDPYYSYTRIETSGSSLPGIEQTYHNVAFLPYVKNPELSDRMQKIFDGSNGRLSRETGPITIDMIRYGCEVGVYVNGLCVLHLPTEPDSTRAVDFNMHTTAIEIDSEEQNMWEITD